MTPRHLERAERVALLATLREQVGAISRTAMADTGDADLCGDCIGRAIAVVLSEELTIIAASLCETVENFDELLGVMRANFQLATATIDARAAARPH